MNPAIRNARSTLWDKAVELPQATQSDFFGSNRPPAGVEPQYIRIISDTSLRTRLIDAGIAEGLQSPKGPQKIPSIIRLYPNFDAPPKDAVRSVRPAPEPPRSAYGLPSVEELAALIERIRHVEAEVSSELTDAVNAEITRLKREIGSLEDEAFEEAFAALDRAITKRRQLAAGVREEAFRRIDADAEFGPRKYLRLVSREPRG